MHLLTPCFLAVALAAAVPAQSLQFNLELIGAQEFPPNNSGGIGTATIMLDNATGAVTVSATYTNLRGNATAAHIHSSARRGANAGVVLALTPSGGTSGTITGGGTVSAAVLAAMRDGLTYLNLHSTVFPGGELRAQIDTVPSSGSPSAPAATITGGATSGSTLTVASPPSINTPVLLLGFPLPFGAVLPLPSPIACVANTNLGFDVTLPFAAIPGGAAMLAIPPSTPNVNIAVQVAFLGFNPCVDLSAANRVAIRP